MHNYSLSKHAGLYSSIIAEMHPRFIFKKKFYSYADLLQFWCDVMSPLHSSLKNYLPKWLKDMLGSQSKGLRRNIIMLSTTLVIKCSLSLATALHAWIDYNYATKHPPKLYQRYLSIYLKSFKHTNV